MSHRVYPWEPTQTTSDVSVASLLVTEYETVKREQAARISTRDNLAYDPTTERTAA